MSGELLHPLSTIRYFYRSLAQEKRARSLPNGDLPPNAPDSEANKNIANLHMSKDFAKKFERWVNKSTRSESRGMC